MQRTSNKSKAALKKATQPVRTQSKRAIKTTKKSTSKATTKKVLSQQRRLNSTVSVDDKVVGFIGLGNMGGHMLNNLVKKGHNVVVYDLSQQNIDTAVSNGKAAGKNVTIAKNPREVALKSDVVVTMLPNSKIVFDTFTNPDTGLVAGLNDRRQVNNNNKVLFIDSSTISPLVAKDIHTLLKDQADFLDSPVSGGVFGAEQGTLTFMLSATEEQLNLATPILNKMGKNIVLCGSEPGSGQVAKICNNLILGISMNAISEGYNLGVKLGMDPKVLASVINTSSGRCWASEVSNPVPGVKDGTPASRDYNGGFGVDLMLKDMNLAIDAAKAVGVPLQLGQIAADNYQSISKSGKGGKDFGYVYQHVAQQKM